ncbi:MAG: hypothetical protein WBZ36_03280 [Candidatus Nitrosopolaris sp.]
MSNGQTEKKQDWIYIQISKQMAEALDKFLKTDTAKKYISRWIGIRIGTSHSDFAITIFVFKIFFLILPWIREEETNPIHVLSEHKKRLKMIQRLVKRRRVFTNG